MKSIIKVSGRILVDYPAADALEVLHDITTLARYEPKVNSVQVTPEGLGRGTYKAKGRFAGLPWGGRFSYVLNSRGFTSELLKGPPGVMVKGGFAVKAISPSKSEITHFENYELSPLALPLVPFARLYLGWAMKKELRAIGEILIERFGSGQNPVIP